MVRQGVKTETSIKDLNCLAVSMTKSSSRTKNLHDTAKTLSTAGQSSLSNNSGSIFDFTPINGGSSSRQNKMNLSGSTSLMMADDSNNSSFSDLAKQSSRQSFESSYFGSSFDASFTASNSSLEWAEDEAFPKSSATASTTTTTNSSTPDISDFVVLSAFQIIEPSSTNSEAHQQEEGEAEEDDDDESHSEDEAFQEEEDDDEESDEEYEEEFPEVDFDDEDITQMALAAEDAEQFFAPSPRDSVKRGGENRRPSLQKIIKQPTTPAKTLEEQAAETALCQHLARSGIEVSSQRRGRARQRGSLIKHQPSPLLARGNSSRSSMTENDVEGLRQHCRRSLSRVRTPSRTPSVSAHGRAPSSRGRHLQQHHVAAGRDRSVSRDRSAATAPAPLEIRLDRPLLGKALLGDDDSEEEEEADPWACPWIGNKAKPPGAMDPTTKDFEAPIPVLCFMNDSSHQDSVMTPAQQSLASTKSRRRHRASIREKGPTAAASSKTKSRRSLRPTKSAEQERGTARTPRSSKRVSLKDCSARSNPEQRTLSLEERLGNLKDASARSNPERSTTRHSREEGSRGTSGSEKRRPSDSKQKRHRSKGKAATTIPPLSGMQEGKP
ncbi:expressed unknown protein [Seminavis robusta]|uniref:Uncharacterized protein n=1 Tax=Seminavis robusta TaxID=568900 RepID=A0A9N8END8_9STRA|nr:expressed unknown protein [Seminavis robusta]|eukprot:Sro1424_g271470.1 n/a (609) ;mRNA; f:16718-18544